MMWKLNTSNQGKSVEYKRLFAKYGEELATTPIDLKEILAEPVTGVTYKAGGVDEGVLVEDTVLDVEGEDVGVQVRWLLEHLPELAGKKAHWTVFLAYRSGDNVYIYRGYISGKIVAPRGEGGFGFDAVFLPDGAHQTLAEAKPDEVNARALVVEALICSEPFAVRPVMTQWDGPWQS